MNKKYVVAVLHNVRSLHNVGSMFRTADAAGVEKLYLTGYTPAPVDVFGKTRTEVAKTALGAENDIEWERAQNLKSVLKKLRREGYGVAALEQNTKSIDYRAYKPRFPIALVIGNEVSGLSPAMLKECDSIIEIPMRGKKESLNVSVAFGIAVYELLK